MRNPEQGRIVRVRMEAEAPELESCRMALNAGFMVIHGAIIRAAESSQADTFSEVFSRETEFGEEVFESQVRPSGAIFYRGRRTISFVEAAEDEPLALGGMTTGTLLSEDDRIRRIQMMPEVGSVDVVRGPNGVWWVTAYKRGPSLLDAPPPGGDTYPPEVVRLTNGQGGTLAEALTEAEAQLEVGLQLTG